MAPAAAQGISEGADFTVVRAAARAGEPDRYLAALLAPSRVREDLTALAALSAELARVPRAVREPMMGELRLQWWRDALRMQDERLRTGHPVADAMRAAVRRHDLPLPLLLDVVEGRSVELEGGPMSSEESFRAYLNKIEGAPFVLAARVLAVPGAAVAAAAAEAGYAYGLARLLLRLPEALSRGRLPLPRSRLEQADVSPRQLLAGQSGRNVERLLASLCSEARAALSLARQHAPKLPRSGHIAFLPLAAVESYLRALERPGRDPLRETASLAPMTRVWRIGVAYWLGRI
jgi:phytoene synthase